jgi:hypothetical protein
VVVISDDNSTLFEVEDGLLNIRSLGWYKSSSQSDLFLTESMTQSGVTILIFSFVSIAFSYLSPSGFVDIKWVQLDSSCNWNDPP